jgi:DNA (cytosine-5)-methyltransferase 1
MTVTGLFAGIGGFELAFSKAGYDTQVLVERDPLARETLRARFPKASIENDINDLHRIPEGTSIITAGFPCQNLSMAGDKSGIDGPKSGVVRKLIELLASSRVPTVVIENVPFMLHLDGGRAMSWLVGQLERLEYRWAYRVLDTMGFGLPHRRRRVYLVASRAIDPRAVLFADDAVESETPELSLKRPIGFYWTEGRSGIGLTVDGIPPMKVGSSLGIPSSPAVLFPDGEVLVPSFRAAELLQGFPAGWVVTAADRYCWRLVGNAVSVPVAEWLARRLLTPGRVLDFPTTSLQPGKWPMAAWNATGTRVSVHAGHEPVAMARPSISAFRDDSWMRLSNRALSGFIARAEQGTLKMPDGFLAALRAAPRKESAATVAPSPVRHGR